MVSKNSEVAQQTEEFRKKLSAYLQSKGINVNSSFNCLNPKHDDHDRCMKYNPNTLSVYCSKCQAYYDIFDVIGNDFGLTYSESRAKVAELFNIPLISSTPSRTYAGSNTHGITTVSPAEVANVRSRGLPLAPRPVRVPQGLEQAQVPPLPLGDNTMRAYSQQNTVPRYLPEEDPIYPQSTSVADANAATGTHQALTQDDIQRRCSEIWGESDTLKNPIEGPVLAPEDDFINPYVVGNAAQGNKRMVLSNPSAPSTLINGRAFNDRQLNKVKSDITTTARREEAARRTRSLSALVADAQSQNARRDPFAPFNNSTNSTIISTGSNRPAAEDLVLNGGHNTTTILSDKRSPEIPALHLGSSDRRTAISGTNQNSTPSSSFDFSFGGPHRESPNTISTGTGVGERTTPQVDFTKLDDSPLDKHSHEKAILSFVDESAEAPEEEKKSFSLGKGDFGIELVSADALKKKETEVQPEDLKAQDPKTKSSLLNTLMQQQTQLDLDLAALNKKTAKDKKEAESKHHDPQFSLAEADEDETPAPVQSEPKKKHEAPPAAPKAEEPKKDDGPATVITETPAATPLPEAPTTSEHSVVSTLGTKNPTVTLSSGTTEITQNKTPSAVKKADPMLENDPIIPVAAAAAQIANEQAAAQAAERASRLFITSTLDEAQSMANLGFAAIALNQPDQSSVLIEQLKIYNNKYTCYICLQPTDEWQECAQELEQELNDAEQTWEELDLISPYADISEALNSDKDLFISRLQELDTPPAQELIRVVAPMKNTGFISSIESLSELQPAHLLYTMVAPNVSLSRMIVSGLIALKKEILFAGSKMQWQMLCNRLSDNAAVIFENPSKDTSRNTRVVSQATREAAINALDLQSYQARLVEMPLELDSRSILLALTQAIMDTRNNESEPLQNPVMMIETFSFEDTLCASIAPLLAELALGLNIPLMVWCSQKQKSFFEGQSVQTLELSMTSDNSIQFKTMDHNCRNYTFCSAPGFKI